MILAMYITESEIPPEWSAEMVRYISRHVNKDGGWGMHTEGKSTLFATALYYVSLRILGMQPEHPLALKARKLILSLGKETLLMTGYKLTLANASYFIQVVPAESHNGASSGLLR
jgi:hypothetical protein